jgi:penicillin-binding protein 1A
MYNGRGSAKKGGSFFAGIARFVLLILLACASGGAGLALQGYFYFTQNLPPVDKLQNYRPPIITQVYADKGELIGEFASERRSVVPFEQIPEPLRNAFVAAEDKNFWFHPGVDTEAILRAVKTNLTLGSAKVGASTITQQVAKTFLLTPDKRFTRKFKEAILSKRIEKSLSKEHILYLYLNQIYLGSRAYGVAAAAQTYFDKDLKDLTIAECALLAGLPKAPSSYSPKNDLKKSLERRAYVLRRMLEDHYISESEYEAAINEEPAISTKAGPYIGSAPDFVETVRKYVENKYGLDALNKEGLQVYTTVSLEQTKQAHEAMDTGLREIDKRQGYRGPIKTLTAQGVVDFLEEKSRNMQEPLHFDDITQGVVTHIDHENIYVRMGTYDDGKNKKEYVGHIKIDPSPKWWVRQPFLRAEKRTRNYAPGDVPFQVGDLIEVKLIDPNPRRREMYQKKYGANDPEMKNYKEYSEAMVSNFPLEVEQEPLVQSALMVRENRSGYVRALLGGNGSAQSKYNRATQAKRQAGSSFKPVIYAAALNKGFTCADIIMDSPIAIRNPETGNVWAPKNYRGGFQGPVTFRYALVHSINIPTIKILQQIGIDNAKTYAKRLGYTGRLDNYLTLALGSTNVTLEDQLNVYSVFPNKGYGIPNVYIKKIVDRDGRVLEQHDLPTLLDDPVNEKPFVQTISHASSPNTIYADSDAPEKSYAIAKRKLDEATSYIMTNLLQGVVQQGTATNLKKIVGRTDIAGKTGTTNESVDAWFMGFSPDYTCGVWVGFDDEISLGDGETGGKAAAPIWGYFMRDLLKDKPVKGFQAPQTVEYRRVNARTGLASASQDGVQEVFKTNTGPAEVEPKLIKGSRWDYSGSDLDRF